MYAEQTEEHLILDGYKKVPWSNIDSIYLKRSEFKNRYIAIYFKDDTPPQGYSIENYDNRDELVHYLVNIAPHKGFTFHVEKGAWPQENIQKTEVPSEEITLKKAGEREPGEEFTMPEITLSSAQKNLIIMGLAVISFLGFYYLFGWLMAVSLFIILLIHETGHLLALRAFHLKVQGLFFIPLVGAAVVPKEEFSSPEIEAAVALGGPAAGLSLNAAALIIDPPRVVYGIFYFIILVNFVINFLNLLPILPLDGGRIARAVLLRGKKSMIFAGIVTVGIGVLLVVLSKDIVLALLVLIGLGSFVYNYQRIQKKEIKPPSLRNSVTILAAWIGIMLLYWYTLPVTFRTFISEIYSILRSGKPFP